LTTVATPELVRFVREVLGCGCPDDIVDRTVVDCSRRGESGLDVGGRLLVRVLQASDPDRLVASLPGIVARLRGERDRRGFNRVRLVVVSADHDALRPILRARLQSLAGTDDRVHIHVVEPGSVPRSLVGTAPAGPP
jgi:hypothetical protein